MKIIAHLLFLFTVALLTACAGQTPLTTPAGPTLEQARTTPAAYQAQSVRWGGRIARVENRREETLIEIVELALSSSGKPRDSARSGGRFMARFNGFLDPVIYAENKLLTVVGTIQPSISGSIGDYPYQFIVVGVEQHQLWAAPESEVIYYYREPFFNSFPHFYFRPYFYYSH